MPASAQHDAATYPTQTEPSRAGTLGATTMKAMVQDVYGSPDVELAKPATQALWIAGGQLLVEAGADVHRVFQGVYESVQFAKLKLLAFTSERLSFAPGRAFLLKQARIVYGQRHSKCNQLQEPRVIICKRTTYKSANVNHSKHPAFEKQRDAEQ